MGSSADHDQPAAHAGTGLLAGVAGDGDLAAGHAGAGTRIGGAEPRVRIAEDPQHPAGHLGARPGAHIATHFDLPARHASADLIETLQIAGQHELLLLGARAGHVEQVADSRRLAAAAGT